ncbi:hypothetical protein E2C01_025396 [Portunus trituberculatus]|uniref:Uncharacterized protein n=1 Tax=Portunus trituberculatus TaxID=210409 RepID=A0A5B7ED91_PORTR|nr:hypothetical protein [Portunus trituberculatus]
MYVQEQTERNAVIQLQQQQQQKQDHHRDHHQAHDNTTNTTTTTTTSSANNNDDNPTLRTRHPPKQRHKLTKGKTKAEIACGNHPRPHTFLASDLHADKLHQCSTERKTNR